MTARPRSALLALASAALLLPVADRPGGGSVAVRERVASAVPERSADAASGSEFARRAATLGGRARQAAAVRELSAGNLPQSLRRLHPITLTAEGPCGAAHTATVWVMPDYLAIGADDDFLRMPLTLPSAVAVARALGLVLPTPKIVDAVYEQAEVRLEPLPMTPGPRMRSVAYYRDHQAAIQRQLGDRPPGLLVAGHKKDVVLTRRLRRARARIAIYGWHRAPGKPIQPLSTVHGARYADYSHGVRLVHPVAAVDGVERRLVELLADPELAPLVSYEGGIPRVGELLDPVAAAALP